MPHPRITDMVRVPRLVTLPDYQGLGLAFILQAKIAAAFKGVGRRLRCYPAHPSFIRSFQRSPDWRQEKEAGRFSTLVGDKTTTPALCKQRPCAVFEWCGAAMDRDEALALLEWPRMAKPPAKPKIPTKRRRRRD